MAEAPRMLNLSQFISVDDAIEKIQPRQRYVGLARSLGVVGVV
jgi:hypothetical protein